MSNRAWMPLHIDTYLADTGYLTAAEHGAYMLLIMTYWRDGGLPDDERMIARIARMSKDEWAESRDVLASFFKTGWRHGRIDEELAKADEIIEKRRSAALGRHSKNKVDASAMHMQSKSTDTGVPPRTLNQELKEEPSGSSKKQGSSPREFDRFWADYPHKVGKGTAETAFVKARRLVAFDDMMAGLGQYAAKTDDRPWCNPATWLNQQRWEDVPAQQPRGSPPRQTQRDHPANEAKRRLEEYYRGQADSGTPDDYQSAPRLISGG